MIRSHMHVVAGLLYAVAAVCELLGLGLVYKFARKLQRVLQTGAVGRIDGGDASGRRLRPDSSDVVALLADNSARPGVAALLLVVGIFAGTAASFLTL